MAVTCACSKTTKTLLITLWLLCNVRWETCILHCDAATANANAKAMVVLDEHATGTAIRGTRQKSLFPLKKRHFSTTENTNANTEHGCECIVIITIQTIRVN